MDLTYVKKNVDAIIKEEQRQFMIAYGHLDEKYHGFLQSLEQYVQIHYETLSDDDLKSLRSEYPGRIFGAWPKEKGKTYFKQRYPYLSLDGFIAIYDDIGEKINIEIEFLEFNKQPIVKAIVETSKGKTIGVIGLEPEKDKKGVVVVDSEGKFIYPDIDVAVSKALRKAFGYQGKGRFPLYKTEYKEDSMILAFREFLKGKKDV